MKKIYLLHGICSEERYFSPLYPSQSNAHWFPWLQKQLMMKGYDCQKPEVPMSYKGHWNDWYNVIDNMSIDDNTILVGHSAGCGAFLKYLSLNPDIKPKAIIMVAPYIDLEKEYGEFLQCDLDKGQFHNISLDLIISDDEPFRAVVETTKYLESLDIKINKTCLSEYGHCSLEDMKTEEFPELLDITLKYLS